MVIGAVWRTAPMRNSFVQFSEPVIIFCCGTRFKNLTGALSAQPIQNAV